MSCCGLPPVWRSILSSKQRAKSTTTTTTPPAGKVSGNGKTTGGGGGNDARDRNQSRTRTPTRELYTYLKRHEIRLLTFKSLEKSATLELEMQTVTLGGLPYEALSYEAGDTSANTTSIRVNDRSLSISATLYEAIDAMRRHFKRSSSRSQATCFWIDAICVNQRHAREKSQQVQLMGRIYSKADSVLMWLGPADRDSNIALRFFERWGALLTNNRELQAILKQGDFQQDVSDRLSRSLISDMQRLGEDKFFGIDRLDAVKRFASRSYWGRAWTVQEQSLARRGTILCGNRSVSASTFWSVAVALFHLRTEVSIPQPEAVTAIIDLFPALSLRLGTVRGSKAARDVYLAILDHCVRTRGLFSSYRRHCDDPVLHVLLEEPRQLKSSDPRDRIYGLMGLLPDNKLPVQPDYKLDVSQVYTRYWTAELQKPTGVKILGILACQLDENDHALLHLPSWVPDFRGRLQEYVEWHSHSHSHSPMQSASPSDDSYSDLTPPLRWSSDGRELLVRGYLFDRIEDVHEFSVHTGTLEQIWNCVDFIFRNYLTEPDSIRQADCPWTVTLFHAYMMGRRNGDADAELILKDPDIRDDVILYYSILAEWAVSHPELDRETAISFLMPPDAAFNKRVLIVSLINKEEGRQMLCKALLRNVATALGLDPQMVDGFPALAGGGVTALLHEVNRKSSALSSSSQKHQPNKPRRRLLLTRDGYVGSIDTGAKRGDFVCLVPGCPRPLVLRREEDRHYERLGEKRCRLIGRANFPFMTLQTDYLTDIADLCLV
ncbi:Heterokaryon incompatibility protein 6 [Escovopsis weberi]|uniref:Heterokaryon incompatibility protein 6 n=1 Tax=Escovopsis weberi TaxID=150374 RepID=A0A0M9VVB2_ESCWE|nr:Heterokaryon incompatibility protein 6 [Escovopsis weberi]